MIGALFDGVIDRSWLGVYTAMFMREMETTFVNGMEVGLEVFGTGLGGEVGTELWMVIPPFTPEMTDL